MILHLISLDLKFKNFGLTNKSGKKWWEGKGVMKVMFHCVVSTEASLKKQLKNCTVTVKKNQTEVQNLCLKVPSIVLIVILFQIKLIWPIKEFPIFSNNDHLNWTLTGGIYFRMGITEGLFLPSLV
jgi:hypothetical protein